MLGIVRNISNIYKKNNATFLKTVRNSLGYLKTEQLISKWYAINLHELVTPSRKTYSWYHSDEILVVHISAELSKLTIIW